MTTADESTVPGADATIQDILRYANTHGYEGLSSSQIEQVINYRAQVLATQSALRSMAEQQKANHAELLAQQQQIASDMREAFNNAMQLRPSFEVVSDEQA